MACCVRKQIHMMPPFKKAEISLDVAEKGSKIKNTWGLCLDSRRFFEKYITGIWKLESHGLSWF